MFIALLLRAMKRDVNLKRVAAFSKRLLQVITKLQFLYLFHSVDSAIDFCLFRLHFSSHHNMPAHAFSFFLNSLKLDHLYGNYIFSVIVIVTITFHNCVSIGTKQIYSLYIVSMY